MVGPQGVNRQHFSEAGSAKVTEDRINLLITYVNIKKMGINNKKETQAKILIFVVNHNAFKMYMVVMICLLQCNHFIKFTRS